MTTFLQSKILTKPQRNDKKCHNLKCHSLITLVSTVVDVLRKWLYFICKIINIIARDI